MFFRFASALILVVLISMLGIRLEQETLRLRRTVSRQYYQTDLLLEQHAHLRLSAQKLTAPSQLAQLPSGPGNRIAEMPRTTRTPSIEVPDESDTAVRSTRLPLLKFQQPFNPEGID